MIYLYADIIINLPLPNPFTYSIPDSLKRSVAVGSVVRVNFANRNIEGVVVKLKNDIDEKIKKYLKAIIAVSDPEPALNDELLRLTKWISEYYMCSWGEVASAALPKRINKKTVRYAMLSLEYSDEGHPKLTAKQKSIIDELKSGTISIPDLNKKIPAASATIKTLVKKNIVQISDNEVFRTPAGNKENSFTAIGLDDLNEKQTEAYEHIVKSIEKEQFNTILLHGVTGSGKTEVYIHAIDYVVNKGKQAIVLVPEISLTPQLIERFKAFFGDEIAVLHSGLGKGERYDEWRRVKENKAKIAIGTRSALFAPFDNIGIIIVDEEHDASYKQSVSPCYNGRDCAVVRGKMANAVVVLGSATPSIESYYNYKTGKYSYFALKNRIEGSRLPEINIVDFKKEGEKKGKWQILSVPLIKAIKDRLKKGEQTILFLNRRGSAPLIQCKDCGYVCQCENCSISLTLHTVTKNLRCHYCDYSCPPPALCPSCRGSKIYPLGVGTQKLEEDALKMFPEARIFRVDRDTLTGKDAYYDIFNKLRSKEVDIIIGTQIITKGHDFPDLTLVGVVSADISLNIPDFRSAERTFHLLTQVAGRAGRRGKKGEVYIQTYNPDHYSITYAQLHDYEQFYVHEIRFREQWGYPPFSRVTVLRVESTNESEGENFIKILKEVLFSDQMLKSGVDVIGPSKPLVYKIKNRYRWHVMLKSKDINALKLAVLQCKSAIANKKIKKNVVKMFVTVDPVDLG